MRAAVFTRYGPPDTLTVREVPKPTPRADEVLIRVHATTVTSADCLMRRGEPRWGRVILGLGKPRKRTRVLGIELAGEIEAVGGAVTRFAVGDRVFGFTGFALGAHAEYATMPATGSLSLLPANKNYAEAAAAVDGGSTALFFLRDKANVQPGQRVLVIGAAGSIGTYAVQLAKHLGAHVTAVCGAGNVELARSLGADDVVDYTAQDFRTNGETYDVIFDTVGKSSFAACRDSLTPAGYYLPTTGLRNVVLAPWTRIVGGKRVLSGMSVKKNAALAYLKTMIEADELTIVLDRSYPLEQIADAHRYVEQGHKRGNVTIACS